MKIDKVLEAHGIGIVQLSPPVIPTNGIVTDGLVGYWNSKQGVNGATWENLAPTTIGQFNATTYGATVTTDGMYFDGATAYVQIPIPTAMKVVTSATFEMRFYANSGWVDMINQMDGRELIWLGDAYMVLSGIFDANKYTDHKNVYYSNFSSKDIYLTITADLTTNKITAYMHDPTADTTVTDSYTTTIDTLSNGDSVFLSGTQSPFRGVLDNMRLYNRVLTQDEITQNWSVGDDLGI